ncbi:MAG: cytochrome c biogenesis protein CcsA [Planctomycetota bacterium]|nr:cytochrome c biogenesis protein CcsA [Planctomycetota bacterium]
MRDLPITLSLAVLTLGSFVATAMSFSRGRRLAPEAGSADGAPPDPAAEQLLRRNHERTRDRIVLLCSIGSAMIFLHNWIIIRGAHGDWQPLESHVDGLALIAAMLGASILYLQWRSRLPGLAVFALPVLTIILAWSVCASAWTYFVFKIDSAWEVAHLAGVYLGSIYLALGAIAGGMYLFAQRRIRLKRDHTGQERLASLESIENFIIRSTGLGFCFLTLAIVAGFIVATSSGSRMGPGWWHSPKLILSIAAWLTYALVLDVRHAAIFRGARAAWMSIAGVLLLLATFSIVNAKGVREGDPARSVPPRAPVPGTVPMTAPLPGSAPSVGIQNPSEGR